MKKALVCGAGGFIGGYLVRRLKKEGYWVRGVDIKLPEIGDSSADQFLLLDLRKREDAMTALVLDGKFDEIYQLAADFGGMGFISSAESEIMHNNVLINTNMISEAVRFKAKRYFFSSSVCIYRDMKLGEPQLTEEDAYPALPDNEYGWEKLYSERVAFAYGRKYPIAVRVARFQNCYGPEGSWSGGREKAPAAICRKVAEAKNNGIIEVWGDGSAVRSYIYIDDLIDGVRRLMKSNLKVPVNIGNSEYVSVDELVKIVVQVSGKNIRIKHVPGPVGVLSRNFSNSRIMGTGWRPKYSLKKGIKETYPWINSQVKKAKENADS